MTEFSNKFQVPVAIEDAWVVLMDVPGIAPCLPGATLTEITDPETFKGTVSLRLGPMPFVFSGMARIVDLDEQGFKATIKANGSDTKGRGGAQATVKIALEPTSDGTEVHVHTALQLSGSIAQFGRSSAIISNVAAQLIGDFERCLVKQLSSEGLPASVAASEPVSRHPIGVIGVMLRAIWKALRRLFETILQGKGNRQ